jgi:hypothetical protein
MQHTAIYDSGRVLYPNAPSDDSLARGFGPIQDERGWLTHSIALLARPIASINDTLSELTRYRRDEPVPYHPYAKTRFHAVPFLEMSVSDVMRIVELQRIRDGHYARIAEALLED